MRCLLCIPPCSYLQERLLLHKWLTTVCTAHVGRSLGMALCKLLLFIFPPRHGAWPSLFISPLFSFPLKHGLNLFWLAIFITLLRYWFPPVLFPHNRSPAHIFLDRAILVCNNLFRSQGWSAASVQAHVLPHYTQLPLQSQFSNGGQ